MKKEVLNKIIKFRDSRDWKQFHTIKDLCLGLGIEVSEFQEIFLWKTNDELENVVAHEKDKIENELADIFIFLSYLCHDLDVDLEKAVLAKLKINESKYPVDKFKGSNKKYNTND